MNETKRERLVQDIVNHKIEEVEVGAGNAISDEEVEDLEDELRECSDDALESWWHSTVGEWIAPMRRWNNGEYYTEENGVEVPVWELEGYDNVIEWQFDKLKETGETDYGYMYPKYTQPYN